MSIIAAIFRRRPSDNPGDPLPPREAVLRRASGPAAPAPAVRRPRHRPPILTGGAFGAASIR